MKRELQEEDKTHWSMSSVSQALVYYKLKSHRNIKIHTFLLPVSFVLIHDGGLRCLCVFCHCLMPIIENLSAISSSAYCLTSIKTRIMDPISHMDEDIPPKDEPLSYADDVPYDAQMSDTTEQEQSISLKKRIGNRIYLIEDSMSKKVRSAFFNSRPDN